MSWKSLRKNKPKKTVLFRKGTEKRIGIERKKERKKNSTWDQPKMKPYPTPVR
jgi:hypothetical protein